MNAPRVTALEEVLEALQRLLDADELDAVAELEVDGRDVYVRLAESGPGCRQCKRTAREIRVALEALPGVDHAYVLIGPETPALGAA